MYANGRRHGGRTRGGRSAANGGAPSTRQMALTRDHGLPSAGNGSAARCPPAGTPHDDPRPGSVEPRGPVRRSVFRVAGVGTGAPPPTAGRGPSGSARPRTDRSSMYTARSPPVLFKRVSVAYMTRVPLGARGVWPSIHIRHRIFETAGSWSPKCASACAISTDKDHHHSFHTIVRETKVHRDIIDLAPL